MKEQEIINKLTLLKTVRPSQAVITDMKHDIYQKVGIGNKKNTFSNVTIALYGFAFVVLLTVFLSVVLLLPNPIHTVILYSKLSFASNQYQKVRIVFADTTNRFKVNKQLQQQPQEFSRSLALVNREMSELKLKGEKGKYTEQECRRIYHEYLSYLEKEEKSIPLTNRSFASVKSQINIYEEESEKKLNMYKSL